MPITSSQQGLIALHMEFSERDRDLAEAVQALCYPVRGASWAHVPHEQIIQVLANANRELKLMFETLTNVPMEEPPEGK